MQGKAGHTFTFNKLFHVTSCRTDYALHEDILMQTQLKLYKLGVRSQKVFISDCFLKFRDFAHLQTMHPTQKMAFCMKADMHLDPAQPDIWDNCFVCGPAQSTKCRRYV